MEQFDKNFHQDVEQAWKAIFKLSDRIKLLEKFNKSQSLLNIFFFLLLSGLIVCQVIIYDTLTR